MCGIIGSISSKPISADWIKDALTIISHRGPDAEGLWVSEDKKIHLGHRRLSIIDLSVLGNQPMHFDDAGTSIVFNGEIYNYLELKKDLIQKGHSFITMSDTEVLLHAYHEYGISFLNRLNGMFAFCIVDKKKGKAYLCRDRAGEKPIFYSYIGDTLSFASELKGLIQNPSFVRKVDYTALDCLFAYGFIPGDLCIYKMAKKLPPAHLLEFDIFEKTLVVRRYWELPSFSEDLDYSLKDDDIKNELNRLLKDAVSKQLIADVPVGVLLSGGVDSSLITAYASMSSSNVRTFTVSFPGEEKFDESRHAQLIARHFGTKHTEIEGTKLTPDLLDLLAWQYDEPMIDSSMLPTYIVTNSVRQYCAVAIGGDGGDELFGGYGHYNRLLWIASKLGTKMPILLRKGISKVAENMLPIGFKGRVWLQSLSEDFVSGLPLIATLFEARFRRQMMTHANHWELVAESSRAKRLPTNSSLLQRATRMDFCNYLPEDILVKVDRASMLNSLELRAPFLDKRVIEFAFSRVPDRLKTNTTHKKIILKQLAKDILPPHFDFKRKQGFGVPVGNWIKSGEWKTFFEDTLFGKEQIFFNRKIVKKVYNSHLNGNENSERLFAMVMFELWRKKYQVSF